MVLIAPASIRIRPRQIGCWSNLAEYCGHGETGLQDRLPFSGIPPADPVISRFVAKVALEAMAHRFPDRPEGLDYLCDEAQFDPIRDHARRGKHLVYIFGTDAFPFSIFTR
jgi:hypothetical protein